MKKVAVIFVFIFTVFNVSYAAEYLRCYQCSLNIADGEKDPDLTCLESPQNTSVKVCPTRMKYCMIYRTDYKESGQIASMLRTCEEKPPLFNDDVEDDKFIAHYRSCQTDLCNSGNGISSGGAVDGNGNGGIGGILVPDASLKNDAVSIIKINTFLLCGVLLGYINIS